jgi:acetyl-CoA carboxylase carboxyltransferase component
VGGHSVVVACSDGPGSGSDQSKLDRLAALAVEKALPFVSIAAGARSESGESERRGLSPGASRIGVIDGLCELSGLAPSVSILAGGAVDPTIPALADLVVATEDSALGLPGTATRAPGVAAAQGDIDIVVGTASEALLAAREYLLLVLEDRDSGEPSPTARRVGAIVPENRRRAYDMRKVIAAISDADSVLELRPAWGPSLITSLVRIDGRTVGVFANQPMSRIAGAIDAVASDKMCRFIEFCDAYCIPLLSLIDSPGFYIGKEAEREGIARHHVRTLSAIEHRDVPMYCVQIRKAYGLGPLVMRGSWGHLPPELRVAWPTVETGGMSLEGAAYLARRKEILAAETPEEARAIRDEYATTLRARESGVRAGQNFSFDDIILPEETRGRVIAMLALSPRVRRAAKKTYLDTI